MNVSSVQPGQIVKNIAVVKPLKNNLILKVAKNVGDVRDVTTKSIIHGGNQRLCFEQIIDERNPRERVVRTFSILKLLKNKYMKDTRLTHEFNELGERTGIICDDLHAKIRKVIKLGKDENGKLKKISTQIEEIK